MSVIFSNVCLKGPPRGVKRDRSYLIIFGGFTRVLSVRPPQPSLSFFPMGLFLSFPFLSSHRLFCLPSLFFLSFFLSFCLWFTRFFCCTASMSTTPSTLPDSEHHHRLLCSRKKVPPLSPPSPSSSLLFFLFFTRLKLFPSLIPHSSFLC